MKNQKSSTNKLFPDLIDNLEGNTLSHALQTILKKQSGKAPYNEVLIATAFWTSSGFFQIADELSNMDSVRLMIGTEVFSKHLFALKPVGETINNFRKNNYKKA